MYEILLFLGVVIWISGIIVYFNKGISSIYHPATYYLFFHGFIFVIRPIFSYFYGYTAVYYFYDFWPSDQDKITALICADIGFIAFMWAVLRVGNVKFTPRPTAGQRLDRQRSSRGPFIVTFLLCAPIAIYSLRLAVETKMSALDNGMLRDAATGVAYNTSSNGYFVDANTMLGPLTVLLAWQFRFRLWSLVPFLAYAGSRLLIGNARWTFVMASAAFAILFLYDRRQKWFNARVVVIGLATLVLFQVIGTERDFFRRLLGGVAIEQPVGRRSAELRPLEGMDFANLEYLEYLIYVVPYRSNTYGYFLDNLQIFTEPIPRVLWPGKPIGPPIQLYHLFDYGNPLGMTYSLPGEGWQQGGYLGVVIWCGLFGVIFGKFYKWFALSEQSAFQVAVYAVTIPLSVQFFRDGTLLTFLKFPMFYVLPILVWMLFRQLSRRWQMSGSRLVSPFAAHRRPE